MTTAREESARLADLLRSERSTLAEFLVALADFDRRRVWLELGHASLFAFLHRDLGLSAGAAYYRKTAAELIQKFPEVLEPLRDGRLCFTSIVELSKNLTPENRAELLPRFFHVSKREAKAISAELQPEPAPPLRTVVTAVRPPAASIALSLGSPVAGGGPVTHVPVPGSGGAQAISFHPDEPVRAKSEVPTQEGAPRQSAAARMVVEPKTAELSRVHITVPRRFLKKLEAARAALSHSRPGASEDEILEAGLDLLLERAAKRRGLVEKPRKTPPPAAPDSDAVPAHVSRAVWTRDEGKCQWKLDSGGICGSTHQVQLDHIIPRALGGPSTIDNLRCACRVHNDRAAREVFGAEWMDQFTGTHARRSPEEPAVGP